MEVNRVTRIVNVIGHSPVEMIIQFRNDAGPLRFKIYTKLFMYKLG